MDLNARQLGSPGHPHVLIAHGLFGSASNWQTIARQLESDFCLWLVDLRNHGNSPHSDDMTYPDMAQDLALFIDTHCAGRAALIGHSMGGKAAMAAALSYPDKVQSLMVMDSAPISHRSAFEAYIEAMMSIDLYRLESRAQADNALSQVVPEAGVRAFLLQNLRSMDNAWTWRINLPVLAKSLPTLSAFPEFSGRFSGPVRFLRGGDSDYVPMDVAEQYSHLFPDASAQTINNAGHWLHAQQPERVTKAIQSFLATT
ncbi:MAG: alpha/beta fold hydrolase [Lysobacterales bacterium]